jgi:DNA-binding MltR family transcriptional regulator
MRKGHFVDLGIARRIILKHGILDKNSYDDIDRTEPNQEPAKRQASVSKMVKLRVT